MHNRKLLTLIGVLGVFIVSGAPLIADITSLEGDRLPAGIRQRRQQDPQAFQFRHAYLELARQSRQTRVGLMSRSASPEEIAAAKDRIMVSGKRSVPVFPVLFKNTATKPFETKDLQARLFGPGADTMTTFYEDNSFKNLHVQGTVADWRTLPEDDTFYEGSDFKFQGQVEKCNGTCDGAKIGELIQNVMDAADQSVDFTVFDNDGPDNQPNSGDDDGFVDFVAFVHPEIGGECSGDDNRNIWSHRSTYSSWKKQPYETKDTGKNGSRIKIEDYVIMPGLNCRDKDMIHIGVFAHEFGHAFGLPDLYDTVPQNGRSQGLGNWCLMASGSWGGDGQSPQRPAHMSAWAKSFLGWVQPRLVDKNTGDLTAFQLKPVQEDKTGVLKVPITASQYYLIEYRPKKGFDSNLPFGGVLIWRVNDAVLEPGLKTNTVNGSAADKGVDLVEADGLNDLDRASSATPPGNRGDAGDAFPGSKNKRVFDAKSTPKAAGGIAVCGIGDPGATIGLSVFVSKSVCQP